MYIFINNSPNYDDFCFKKEKSNENTKLNINPSLSKLLSGDKFILKDDNIEILKSYFREKEYICGVLVLTKNKTYGSQKEKYFYKCIPDDKTLPYFFIPYKIKNIGFEKIYLNKYVIFRFENWTNKFPVGKLIQCIGNVNCFDSYCLYKQYCKNLFIPSSSFANIIKKKIKILPEESHIQTILNKNPKIINLKDKETNIFSIDPENSKDFDDAFSVKIINENEYIINIYIANVYVWFEYLNLWEKFTNKKSTIYFPHRNDCMIPKILSENICSLIEGKERFSFVCELTIKNNSIVKSNIFQALIKVNKNFHYDCPNLKNNKDYLFLLNNCKILQKNYNYLTIIQDSHDLVSYLMIMMNYKCGMILDKYKNGIFRCLSNNDINFDELKKLPNNVSNKAKILFNPSAIYCDYQNKFKHSLLNIENYVHITSPIRRIVDFINQIIIIESLSLSVISDSARTFYNDNLTNINNINLEIKQIKRLQVDCHVLNKISQIKNIDLKLFEGYILSVEYKEELYFYRFYIDELKIIINGKKKKKIEIFKHYKCKIYLFDEEDTLMKKIKIDFLDEDRLENKENI